MGEFGNSHAEYVEEVGGTSRDSAEMRLERKAGAWSPGGFLKDGKC